MDKKVLVIEDDPEIISLLKIHLKDLNCSVDECLDGGSGLEMGLKDEHDLIILDLMLPVMDGLEICRQLRARDIHVPILMLTAKSEEIDKVLGLETGADDYLTKPFSVREFIARVKAIFRRIKMQDAAASDGDEQGVYESEGLMVDVSKRKVTLHGERIDLTPKEFDLLALLMRSPGKSYPRERLLQLVWGYEFEGYEHTVNSHINRLRAKIEPDIANPKFILTTWGIGYRFMD